MNPRPKAQEANNLHRGTFPRARGCRADICGNCREAAMTDTFRTERIAGVAEGPDQSAVSWAAIAAGAVANAALTLVLLAFGSDMGFPRCRRGETRAYRPRPSRSRPASI